MINRASFSAFAASEQSAAKTFRFWRGKGLARFAVGLLLFNTFSPVFASLIPEPVNPIILPETTPMVGVPIVKEGASSGKTTASSKRTGFRTTLDEMGRRIQPITPTQVREFIVEAERPNDSRQKKAALMIQVGEGYLGLKEPAIAEEWFQRASKTSVQNSFEYSLARYNTAISLFRQGRYREAADSFKNFIAGKTNGIDRRVAAMFYRHADACADYHEIRAKADITEPYHLDPLCCVAATGVVLRTLKRDFTKDSLEKTVPHTGEGSSFEDLTEGAGRLGLNAHPISLTNEGLKALFKANKGVAIIARVEHDHFVAVVGADEKGVQYVCSDCGEWPGGNMRLTWDQWKLMEADAFLALAPKGSDLT